jgi:transglutaminase-like putative cysteine protease
MEEEQELDPWWKGPIKYILGLVLIFLLILWYFPTQAIKLDPEPSNIPTLNEVAPWNITPGRQTEINSRNDYLKLVVSNDPIVKQIADRIVTSSCTGNKICYAKAIYYFVRDNFQYVSDPTAFEYVKSARESLATRGGDCDDASVLAANLLNAIGIRTRFVFIPRHVYIQAYLPDALKRYKTEDTDYVSLDLTCNNCKFGELPYQDFNENKIIVG